MRFTSRTALILLLAALTASLGGGEMRLVFTSDLHGRLRNYAALAPAIRAEAGKNGIVLDLGDTVSGVFSSEHAENGTGMAEALRLCGTELWIPGNHDFELPPAAFRDFVKRFGGIALGEDWHNAGISGKPFALLERGNIRCAVIGLTDPKMPRRILPGSGMTFDDPRAVLRRLMPRVRAAGAQVVVLAWHNGLYSGAGYLGNILKEFPGIDVVLGAHSHQENPGQRVGNALFVQSGAHGHAAGVVEIRTDDRRGRILSITSRLIRGDALHPMPELMALDRHLENVSAGVKHRVLGNFSPPLSAPRPGEYDSKFGRICAKALRTASGSDAAVIWINCSECPEKLPRLTYGKLAEIIPYRNELCVLSVTGSELERFIAEQETLSRRRKWSRMLFASGLRLSRPANGGASRVIGPEGPFTVAVNSFLITESKVLRPLADLPERHFRRLGRTERELIADYISERAGGAMKNLPEP